MYTTNRKKKPSSAHFETLFNERYSYTVFSMSRHKHSSNANIGNLITVEKSDENIAVHLSAIFFVVVIWTIEFWIQYAYWRMAIHLRHINNDNEHAFELQLQRLINIFFFIFFLKFQQRKKFARIFSGQTPSW